MYYWKHIYEIIKNLLFLDQDFTSHEEDGIFLKRLYFYQL